MMNVCPNCGEYRADKTIDPDGPYAVCPLCGHRHPFRQLPLLVVSGASGAGKSAVLRRLVGCIDRAVLLDSDMLWRSEFNQPEENYRGFFETWLRLCKNISQSGRPVVLFGAGVGVPANLEACVERRYVADVHILALVCDDEVLAERLRSRPEWRKSGDPSFVAEQMRFNRWFQDRAGGVEPAIELLDTTGVQIEETARCVAAWIASKVGR